MILYVLALWLLPLLAPYGFSGERKVPPDATTIPFMKACLRLVRKVMRSYVQPQGLMLAHTSFGPAAGKACTQDGSW